MPRIFISYRRDDAAFAAHAIYEKLKDLFGEESITFDVNFSLGMDFAKKIEESVYGCDVLLAIIGDRWLNLRFKDGPMQGQRRLDDPNDWVRLEIASALKKDILVVPVLVGKVSIADLAPELPPDLADLTKKVALSVRTGPDLPNDLQLLVRGVKRAMRLAPLTPADLALPPGVKVVPQGLRSFNEKNDDFFIYLLPGPYQADGLPERLCFWKTRIEATDPKTTFRVGLIYGPSGCGKSSLVRAGLLPRLDGDVTVVYVEATATDTEARLLAALHEHCPYLGRESSLLTALRHKDQMPSDKKVLLVLDQFEQYLHSTSEDEQDELAEALRECDGENLQCILMVRDDFLTPATRFMKRLDIPLAQEHNLALVDLFDRRHAKKVLALLGQAYGGLPASGSLRKEQDAFLNQAISELAEGDHVISVRLALFAQMFEGKEWKPAALKAIGGATGVGVAFLEESFVAQTAPEENRLHKAAAQRVLAALLPEPGTTIKGAMRTKLELLNKSGYARRPEQFDQLLEVLDTRLRLVTPTDPVLESNHGQPQQAADTDRRYQLTHDYLVPSLRDWLTRKQKETRRGRAELRLAERSELWSAKPENRYLPSLWESLNIRLLTDRKDWTGSQRKMMGKAGRVHGIRAGIVAAMLVVASIVSLGIRNAVVEKQNATRAEGLVATLVNAEITEVPSIMSDLDKYRPWAIPLLQGELGKQPTDTSEEAKEVSAKRTVNAAVALLKLSHADKVWPLLKFSPDPRVRTYLIHSFAPLAVDVTALVQRLGEEPDVSSRRALVLCLGEFDTTHFPSVERQALIAKLLNLYQNDPDPGLHGAAEWLLRQKGWDQGDKLSKLDAGLRVDERQLQARKAADKRQWYVNTDGQTFVILNADKPFLMGSPDTEPDRGKNEALHQVRIGRTFAIGSKIVTKAQFRHFQEANPDMEKIYCGDRSHTDDSPQVDVDWYDAARYCNWLSKNQGIPKEQWCYEPNSEGKYAEGMKPAADYLHRSGYRLPTEAEWEYACRSGTQTSRYYGLSVKLLPKYAWFHDNSENPAWLTVYGAWPVGMKEPNDYGLFDMYGNAQQWCDDSYSMDAIRSDGFVSEDLGIPSVVGDKAERVTRGGSFYEQALVMRSASRGMGVPKDRSDLFGFRAARTYP